MIAEGVIVKCPVCSTQFETEKSKKVPYATIRTSDSVNKPQTICSCPVCEVGIAFPLLNDDEIDSLYTEGDYWQTYKVKYLLPRKDPGQYTMAETRWRFVEEQLPFENKAISILDIGGGHGFFGMAAAKSKKIKLQKFCVVEKDKFFNESLKMTWEKFLPAIKFSVEDDIDKVEGRFDVVVLSHILEHLNDPRAMIRKAAEKLSDGGLIFVDVPHQDYLFKKEVFPHVLFYNTTSLKRIFSEEGLDVQRIDCFGRDRQEVSKAEAQQGILKLSEKIIYKARHVLPIELSKTFFSYFFKPSQVNGNGTWIRTVAKKKIVSG